MSTISVVISAWNEEKKIERCLKSVTWADEIILIDNTSSDKTGLIARKYKSKVFVRPNDPMLNKNKNYGFEKATSDWILSLDADEEITTELKTEIQCVIKTPSDIVGYWIPRKNIIFGQWIQHGLWWPDRQLRLFQSSKGKFPCVHVHEYIEVQGKTEILVNPYTHYNYETVSQFIRKMDSIYTENEVNNLKNTNYHLQWFDAIRFPVSDFVKIYFAQEGYKDGLHGLVLSILQAFYSFVIFAKLWESNKFPEQPVALASIEKELSRSFSEITYWNLSAKIKDTKEIFKKMIYKIQRRFV